MIGDDKYGHAFAGGYEPAREQIEAATRHGALLLGGVQRGAGAMATTHETCDEAHARQLGA